MDRQGQLTQVDFDTNLDRVLSIKGTNASDDDAMGEVFEVPINSFLFAVKQEKPFGPITSIGAVKLPTNL